MAIYTYICQTCGHAEDYLKRFQDKHKDVQCSKCKGIAKAREVAPVAKAQWKCSTDTASNGR